jgi:hypothetical protein
LYIIFKGKMIGERQTIVLLTLTIILLTIALIGQVRDLGRGLMMWIMDNSAVSKLVITI